MAVDIVIPAVGESITEGTIGRWLKPDGTAVAANEPILELETDKATQEIVAPAAGTLSITVKEGQKVAIGSIVGRIDPAGKAAQAKPATPAPKPAAAAVPLKTADMALSPAVRQLIRDEDVDASQLTGTGRGGRITKEDVLAHLAKQQATTNDKSPAAAEKPTTPNPVQPPVDGPSPWEATKSTPRETRLRMTTIRQRIAERLLAAQQNAAILTTFNEADMTAVMALRAKYKDAFKTKHGVGLGFMGFFVKAVVEALKAFPAVNGRIDGNEIVYHNYYDIGVAVSTEKGLMVPILRSADQLSFAAIENGIVELATKARDNKIGVQDLQGGTFTITNGGIFGSLLSTPILNPPQSGILGMHTIQKRPVAIDDQVVIRPMMYLAFSYDHRLIDGREAVSFLVRVKECIETPERLLLEI
jgi:2-oxoglutarate dehydrogenase E2 component (dihydrolipoamide succinyltransferase)